MNPVDLTQYPYPSTRRVVLSQHGAVATSQPLAAMAGMEMLVAGGNAVDAAIATAIALTVVEPTSNGIGSDAFALVWDGKLQGLNASGYSPAALSLKEFDGMRSVPELGWLPVTVPGAVSAWRTLWERYGKLPFERLFEPAIRCAEGFPVSPVTAQAWKQAEQVYLPQTAAEFEPFKAVFFPEGRAPRPGEIWRSPLHRKTLEAIASSGGESFYRGELAEKMAAFAAATGGFLTQADLAAHQPDWVDPISTTYRDLTVWEIPPNGQGLTTLLALNILENFDLANHPRDSVESYHLAIESMKLAVADAYRYIADPRHMEFPYEWLLDKSYAQERSKLIGTNALPLAQPGLPKGGTVYLAAADGELMVSFIQSNYAGFGSGILVPDTGIALQNRGTGFVLRPDHPNCFQPGKRPFHTIIPGFLTRNGKPLGPFGVMGGAMQPQGHLQVVVNLADYVMNPQAALDAPRWRFMEDNKVLLEPQTPEDVVAGLQNKGHKIGTTTESSYFGRGQMILRHDDVLMSASEPRADGLAIGW
ncbi:gamma-glutamyltransferase family protein [Leptolyngbya sp. FACHB-671]|uniref:gamma-glutamyltransferase family protein n=1 Tax=Leptolyngbya sp. FACHB-671 TaxID=2692812 RepID=UPI00321F70A6